MFLLKAKDYERVMNIYILKGPQGHDHIIQNYEPSRSIYQYVLYLPMYVLGKLYLFTVTELHNTFTIVH